MVRAAAKATRWEVRRMEEPSAMLFLGRRRGLFGFARTRAEFLPGRGHDDRTCVPVVFAVLRKRSRDGDHVTNLDRGAAPSAARQDGRRSHFKGPVRNLAGRLVLHVYIEIDMRIGPVDLRDRSR